MKTELPSAPAVEQSLDRRSFLRLTALAGGGFAVGYSYLGSAASALAAEGPAMPPATVFGVSNNHIRVGADGVVTIYSARPEVGQGIKTSLPMIIAEEMDVNWKDVKIINSSIDPDSNAPVPQAAGTPGGPGGGGRGGPQLPNLDGPMPQSAGGSTSTPSSYDPLRRLGAAARAVLVEAAAQTWGVPAAELTTESSAVLHKASNRRAPYAQLVAKAATLPVPSNNDVTPKDPKDYKLLGTRVSGVENPAIVTGQPLFGIDQKVPGMAYAIFERCPTYGSGAVTSANLDEVKKLPGVKDAFIVTAQGGVPHGVAILATSTWAAFSARAQLKVVFDEGTNTGLSWAGIQQQAQAIGAQAAAGDGEAFAGAAKTIEAAYSFPYISHAPLEPQNCLADVKADRAVIWAPTQNAGDALTRVLNATGLPRANVKIHVTRSGGGFGRRLNNDFAGQAALISKLAGVPVKLQWSREDDIRYDLFRPAGFGYLKGGLDAQGKLLAWRHHRVSVTGGGAGQDNFPQGFGVNVLNPNTMIQSAVPTFAWRAPNSCTGAWVTQSFLDELAHAAGRDPLEFKLALLANAQAPAPAPGGAGPGGAPGGGRGGGGPRGGGGNPQAYAQRMTAIVKLAAEKLGWGKRLPRGQGQGIAFYSCHQGYVAEAAEVTVSRDGKLTVDRVVAVCDVGHTIVNLSGAENQAEGAIVDGLSTMLYPALNLEKGRMVETNFDDYQLALMPDAPKKIEVHFVKSANNPTGLGEPTLPPVAPAVCNAIFAATGIRVREFPLTRTSLKWS
jgi:isoquinoline 1-oxidoreductase beta subunit